MNVCRYIFYDLAVLNSFCKSLLIFAIFANPFLLLQTYYSFLRLQIPPPELPYIPPREEHKGPNSRNPHSNLSQIKTRTSKAEPHTCNSSPHSRRRPRNSRIRNRTVGLFCCFCCYAFHNLRAHNSTY